MVDMGISKLLTIVIPCKNEGSIVGELLVKINNQNNINETKVYVCDSSDDLVTYHYLKPSYYNNIKLEILEGGFPSKARSIGADKSDTPYILFLDCDMEIKHNDFICNILNEIQQKKGSLLTCKVRTNHNKYNKFFKLFFLIQKLHLITKPFALGGIMLFNKTTYNKVGGFNPEDKFAEDYNLSKKIKSNEFILSNEIINTSYRRFEIKGIKYIIKMMILSFINKNNPNFFKKEHSYWK